MGIKSKLIAVLFLEYFIWGSWLITIGSYMFFKLDFTGVEIGAVYSTMGIASLIMPSLLGIVADRWIPANRLFMLCHLVGAISLFAAASVTTPTMMFLVILINCLAFMPTIAISNAISYFSLEKDGFDVIATFPKVRVFGTIGFILAMWVVNLLEFNVSNSQLYLASGASILLCLCAATLPHVPTAPKNTSGQKESWVTLLGLQSFVLFKQPKMAVFFIFSLLLGGILQITNTFGDPFLQDFGKVPEFADSLVVRFSTVLLSISQISEVVFILFVPYFMKKFGIKYVMLIAIVAWAIRFGLFAYGDPTPMGFILLLMSMIVYGCAFDFYNISGSIYVEMTVDKSIRNSAQGLFMMMTNGVGAYLGSLISGWVVDYFTASGVRDWHNIWLIFSGYSLILAVIFMFVFKNSWSAKAATA